MFPSIEVRWFYQEMIPSDVAAWFQQGRVEPGQEPGRVDSYLRLGELDALGIKLREGRIEIKQRQRQHGIVAFCERLTGLVEAWRKWSLPLASAEGDLSGILVPASSWIPVQKERSVLKYQVTADGRSAAVPSDSFAVQGCMVELTSIRAGGEAWWSLGFEAFGEGCSLLKTLLPVVEHVLARGEIPLPFDESHSYGYPAWLSRLGQRF